MREWKVEVQNVCAGSDSSEGHQVNPGGWQSDVTVEPLSKACNHNCSRYAL